MPRSAAPITISEFQGFNNSDPAHSLPLSVGTYCANLYFENGKLYPRKATSLFKALAVESDPDDYISNLGLYAGRINEELFLISVAKESSGGDDLAKFYRWLDDGNPVTAPTLMDVDEATFYTADDQYGKSEVEFARTGDVIYAGNGQFFAYYDVENDVWKKVQMPVPGAAPAVAVGGAGLLRGTYRYYIAYKDEERNIIGNPSPASDYITVTDEEVDLTFTAIPAGYVGVIYRVGGTTIDTMTVAEVAAAATTYTDNISDDDLGIEIVFNADPIPNVKYIEFHKNRLIAAYSNIDSEGQVVKDQTTLFISYYGQPWRCPLVTDIENPLDGARLPISMKQDSKITGLKPYGDYVLVFTKSDSVLLSGDDPTTFRLSPSWPIGCAAHRTIQNVDGALTWLSDSGDVYAWDGQGYPVVVSKSIRNTTRNWSAAEKDTAIAWQWRGKYFLKCGVEIFFMDRRAASQEVPYPWGEIALENTYDIVVPLGNDDDNEEKIFGLAASLGKMVVLEDAEIETEYEDVVFYEWKSKQIGPQDERGLVIDAFESRIRNVRILIEGFTQNSGVPSPSSADQQIHLGLQQDTQSSDSETHDVAVNGAYSGETYIQYDEDAGDEATGHSHQLHLYGSAFSNDDDDQLDRYHPTIHSIQVLIRPVR